MTNRRFLWLNLVAMALVSVLVVWGVLRAVDTYTRHGEAVVVPDVKGMSVDDAQALFSRQGLDATVADSTYVKQKPAGCILEHHPAAGQKVKRGRLIYLTMNTNSVPLQAVPDVADNSSRRQAEARILATGFKLDSVLYIPGELDWVYGVTYNDRELAIGDKVPMGATLRLVVGNGENELSEAADSLNAGGSDRPADAAESAPAAEESWF